MRAYIKAISYYLPEKVLTNAELCQIFPDLSEKDIVLRTGVKQRFISAPLEIGSDVAFASAEIFFREHNIAREEVDFLIFCTEGLDYKAPATACVLQNRIGLPQTCGAIDVPLGCTGFVYGLSLAKALIESSQARNVLLLTSDVPSKVIHPDDSELRSIFSDGGAATLVSATEEAGSMVGDFVFGTDGRGAENLIVRYSGSREPISHDWLTKYKNADGMKWGKMEMNGSEIFIFAIKVVPPMIRRILEKNQMQQEEVDLFIFHQASGFLLEILRKKLKIPKEKFFVCLENVGNTVSATIPIALKEAMKQGKAKKGDKILLAGFGIGYSWSGTIVTI